MIQVILSSSCIRPAAAAAAAVAVAVAADASRVSRAVSRNLRANQIITNAIEAREKIQ